MHSLTARIALLAYLIGGLAVPAVHWHAPGAASHLAAGHAHEGHANPVPACCHTAPQAEGGATSADEPTGDSGAAKVVVDGASPPGSTCGEDCVVCIFAGSAQASPAGHATLLVSNPLGKIAIDSQGPGFAASDLGGDRLRGPPVRMVLA